MENDQDIVTAFVHDPKRKLLLASHAGNGFVVPEAEVIANTRKGKQVMNVKSPDEASHCAILSGDHLAIVGEKEHVAELDALYSQRGIDCQREENVNGVQDALVFSAGMDKAKVKGILESYKNAKGS